MVHPCLCLSMHWIDSQRLRNASPYVLMITRVVVLLLSPAYLCIIVQGLFECMRRLVCKQISLLSSGFTTY